MRAMAMEAFCSHRRTVMVGYIVGVDASRSNTIKFASRKLDASVRDLSLLYCKSATSCEA
jgi:hypothetical protein